MGKAWEVGREWKGIEVTEYCDRRSLPACDIETGLGAAGRFCWGEVVMMGGKGGWLGFEVGEETGGGEVAGDEAADMTVDMFRRNQRVGLYPYGSGIDGLGYVACDVA